MSITSRKVQRSPFEWRSQAILNYSSVIPREVPGILITSYELNWMVLCCGSCTIFHEETRGMSFIVNMSSWIKQTFCFLNRGSNNFKEKEANGLHQVWCSKICSKIWPSHNHSKYPVSPYSTYKLNKLNDSYAPKYRTKGADTFSCVAVEISFCEYIFKDPKYPTYRPNQKADRQAHRIFFSPPPLSSPFEFPFWLQFSSWELWK